MYAPTAAQLQQLDQAFRYHPPHGNQTQRYEQLRTQAHALATRFVTSCPPSRELSTALTRLEEAVMHANAAIARNEPPDPPLRAA